MYYEVIESHKFVWLVFNSDNWNIYVTKKINTIHTSLGAAYVDVFTVCND